MRRLDQLLSSLGYCSRSEAKGWIADGRVTIGAVPADDSSQKASPAEVRVDDEVLDHPGGLLLAFNKPLGVVCSHEVREGPRVYDLLPVRWQRRNPAVTSIGRLDRDTTGLILLTDQTALVHRLTSPKHKVPKVYQARLNRDVSPDEGQALVSLFGAGALVLEGEPTPCLPAVLRWKGPQEAELILTEGRYHQVRRMFASQGLTVAALHRSQFGSLALGDLASGSWLELAIDHSFT